MHFSEHSWQSPRQGRRSAALRSHRGACLLLAFTDRLQHAMLLYCFAFRCFRFILCPAIVTVTQEVLEMDCIENIKGIFIAVRAGSAFRGMHVHCFLLLLSRNLAFVKHFILSSWRLLLFIHAQPELYKHTIPDPDTRLFVCRYNFNHVTNKISERRVVLFFRTLVVPTSYFT
jgi:hypothetical protein